MALRREINLRHHWSSEIYGQGKAFRRILGLPKWCPLLFTADHGAAVGADVDLSCLKIPTLVRLHFTWSQPIANAIRALDLGRLVVKRSLHPWVEYRLLEKITRANKPEGTIFFPHHSSGGVSVSGYSDESCIQHLKDLPNYYHPITICFYHPDLSTERPRLFQEAGFKVTSAGNTFDYNFVDNFYNLISRFAFSISEGWGSQVAYCVDLGIPSQVIPRNLEVSYAKGSSIYFGMVDNKLMQDLETANKIFDYVPGNISVEQEQFVRYTLGYSFGPMKKKDKLFIWMITFINFPIWLLITVSNAISAIGRYITR